MKHLLLTCVLAALSMSAYADGEQPSPQELYELLKSNQARIEQLEASLAQAKDEAQLAKQQASDARRALAKTMADELLSQKHELSETIVKDDQPSFLQKRNTGRFIKGEIGLTQPLFSTANIATSENDLEDERETVTDEDLETQVGGVDLYANRAHRADMPVEVTPSLQFRSTDANGFGYSVNYDYLNSDKKQTFTGGTINYVGGVPGFSTESQNTYGSRDYDMSFEPTSDVDIYGPRCVWVDESCSVEVELEKHLVDINFSKSFFPAESMLTLGLGLSYLDIRNDYHLRQETFSQNRLSLGNTDPADDTNEYHDRYDVDYKTDMKGFGMNLMLYGETLFKNRLSIYGQSFTRFIWADESIKVRELDHAYTRVVTQDENFTDGDDDYTPESLDIDDESLISIFELEAGLKYYLQNGSIVSTAVHGVYHNNAGGMWFGDATDDNSGQSDEFGWGSYSARIGYEIPF